MATFENAAEDLAKKIATLDNILDKADDRFNELQKQLSSLEEGINQDFSAVIEQAQSFFSKLQEEREALAREVTEAGQKVSEAQGQVGQSRAEAEGALGEARGRLEGLTTNLSSLPQVETMVAQGAEAPSQALAQMAGEILSAMQQAMEGARELLESDASDELDQMRQDLEERVDAVKKAAEEAGEEVDRAYAEFSSRVSEVAELVQEEALEAAGKHIKEVVDYAVDECSRAHEEEIANLGQMAGELSTLLDGLKDEIETSRDRVRDEGEEPLTGDMGDLTAAVNAAQSALDEVKALLASYTFVQL